MSRGVVLCADDFGLTPGIDRAVVTLIEMGRLSAVSCMTGAAHWAEHSALLKPFIGRIDIGLHVTLVDEKPITAPHQKFPGIGKLIVTSYLGLVDLAEIEREVDAQFDAFESQLGRPPDHVDGHLHAHVLPGISEVISRIAARRAPGAYWRNVNEPVRRVMSRGIAVPKTLVIATLGARVIDSNSNDGFSGVYGLRGNEDVATLFAKFLATDAHKPIVMCHPGEGETGSIAAARANEYSFLTSPAFADLLSRMDLSVRRFAEL